MVSYKIEILKSADKDIRKIDKRYILPIFQAIKTLSKDPLPTECKKLKGSESSYRIRVGNYRIIYKYDVKEKIITIFHIRHWPDYFEILFEVEGFDRTSTQTEIKYIFELGVEQSIH